MAFFLYIISFPRGQFFVFYHAVFRWKSVLRPLVSLSIFPVMDRYIFNFTKEYAYVYSTLYL